MKIQVTELPSSFLSHEIIILVQLIFSRDAIVFYLFETDLKNLLPRIIIFYNIEKKIFDLNISLPYKLNPTRKK